MVVTLLTALRHIQVLLYSYLHAIRQCRRRGLTGIMSLKHAT